MDPLRISESEPSLFARAKHGGSAARTALNSRVIKLYIATLCILFGIFIIGHWTRILAAKVSRSKVFYPITAVTRTFRRFALRKVPGFSSSGNALLVFIFVAMNILFTFWNVDYSKLENLGARLGWMSAANFAFVVFLSLKNTPLSFLTAYSYERLNCLHRIVGYTLFVVMVLHAIIYSYNDMHAGKWSTMHKLKIKAGIVCGFAALTSVVAATTLRRKKYELFYVLHVSMFIVMAVTIGLHRKKLKDRVIIITLLTASMWFADRLIRGVRLLHNFFGNEITVFPLSNGGTRVVFKKSICRARPGKHCYLWIPHIRPFQTHPFTIVATEPLELVIQTRDGFTQALYEYASANPGGKLRASAEGPYGTFPDPTTYDKVLLVAGGAGATFTLGLASNIIQRIAPDSNKQIDFIWVVRDKDNVTWFTRYLKDIFSHENAHKVLLKLHLTRCNNKPSHSTSPSLSEKALESHTPSEKDLERAISVRATRARDSEAGLSIDGLNLPVVYGRPDIEASIQEAIASCPKDQRILIAACGPTGLTDTVRDTAARCISADGPSVELHCEQFGW